MNNNTDDVDFDFFDTPSNVNKESPKSKIKSSGDKPPAPTSHISKHDDKPPRRGNYMEGPEVTPQKSRNAKYSDSSDSSSCSDSDSETPRYEKQRAPAKSISASSTKTKHDDYSLSESSSAYSNSDYSSDEEPLIKSEKHKKEIAICLPTAQEAWKPESSKGDEVSQDKRRKDGSHNYRNERRSPPESESSEEENRKRYTRNDRVKSAKNKDRSDAAGRKRRSFKSVSSSFSNNSDITDVSPLESPETSPRHGRRSKNYSQNGKENGSVQYRDSDSADIKLDTDQVDLSLLMKCMAEIDRDKKERVKTNSRRVMFTQPAANEKKKSNYSFSVGRAQAIEKENQRLLKQIMMQVRGGPNETIEERKAPRKPKKATQPVVQRLTPSAVNRMREQRRIESENMHILSRLQTIRPTQGMSKTEQLSEFDRQASYGVPTGTLIIPGVVTPSRIHSSLSQSSISKQRSRPSSAKSNTSLQSKRSRPSSAKSNASAISNFSLRSNTSSMSIRSNVSQRRGAASQADNRPQWDDRFSYS